MSPLLTGERGQIIPIVVNQIPKIVKFCSVGASRLYITLDISEKNSDNKNFLYCSESNSVKCERRWTPSLEICFCKNSNTQSCPHIIHLKVKGNRYSSRNFLIIILEASKLSPLVYISFLKVYCSLRSWVIPCQFDKARTTPSPI